MIAFLFDENLNERIIRGLRRAAPKLDVVRVIDAGLKSRDDPDVLDWAAAKRRIVLTHDVNTMPAFAHERLADGKPFAGLIIVPASMPIGQAINEIELLAECLEPSDCEGQVLYLPL